MQVGIIGDSQSEGLAPSLVPRLQRKGLEVTSTMLVRGMSLRSLLASSSLTAQARAVAGSSPDALIVILGGNNRIENPTEYAALVDRFLSQIARLPKEIWWVGPAASRHSIWGPRHARTRAIQSQVLPARADITWIDAWPMTRSGVEFAPDGLHFTRRGYATWAPRLADEMPPSAPLGLLLGAALLGGALGFFLAITR